MDEDRDQDRDGTGDGRLSAAARMAGQLALAARPQDVADLAGAVLDAAEGVDVDLAGLLDAVDVLVIELTEDPDDGVWDGSPAATLAATSARLREALAHPAAQLLDVGRCALGPALLAIATAVAGRVPLCLPGAAPVPRRVALAAADALGWSRAVAPTARVAAALAARDPRLLTALALDGDLLVRVAGTGMGGDATSIVLPARPPMTWWPNTDWVAARAEAPDVDEALAGWRPEGRRVPELALRLARDGRLTAWGRINITSDAPPDPVADYFLRGRAEQLRHPIPDQFGLSHESKDLTVRFALGPVALVAQVGWGGAYADREGDDRRWNQLVGFVDAVTSLLSHRWDPRPRRRRWLIVMSELRGRGEPELLAWRAGAWRRFPLPADDAAAADPHDVGFDEPADVAPDLAAPAPHPVPPSERELPGRAAWRRIVEVIDADLQEHERDWLVVPEPGEPDRGERLAVAGPHDPELPEELCAVVDATGHVRRAEYAGDLERLWRVHGVWTDREPPAPDWPLGVRRRWIEIDPDELAVVDVAADLGLMLPERALRAGSDADA